MKKLFLALLLAAAPALAGEGRRESGQFWGLQRGSIRIPAKVDVTEPATGPIVAMHENSRQRGPLL